MPLMTEGKDTGASGASLAIYVSCHCAICVYAYEVAEIIGRNFPKVNVSLIDMEET